MPHFISKRAAAKYLKVSRMRIYELLASGSLSELSLPVLEKWQEEHADARLRYKGLLPRSALRKTIRKTKKYKYLKKKLRVNSPLRQQWSPSEWLLQRALIRQARHAGLTLQTIATELDLTRERIRQICLYPLEIKGEEETVTNFLS